MQRKKKMEQLPKRDDVLYLDIETQARMIGYYWKQCMKKWQIDPETTPKAMLEDLYIAFCEGWIAFSKMNSELSGRLIDLDELMNRQV